MRKIELVKVALFVLGASAITFCANKEGAAVTSNTGVKENVQSNNNSNVTIDVVKIHEKYVKSEGTQRPSRPTYNGTREMATGKIIYVGPDIHGTPSIGLTDEKGEKTYVLAVFSSNSEIRDYKVGQIVTISGNYHIMSSEDEVVIKSSKVEKVF